MNSDDRAEAGPVLIDEASVEEFSAVAAHACERAELSDILYRAINFTLQSDGDNLELSFISLYAALESVLTFFRRQDEYEILRAEEFSLLESDLRRWLKQHALLRDESVKRGLIYEKIRELNRFPFSYVFKRFCEHYSLDLSDLWPVLGRAEEWPLMEIRHRLVHGDPFLSRPAEALTCARLHLRWVVERMLLSVLGWPISRSNVSPAHLLRMGWMYEEWQSERAKFA
ncbi:MAG TPA: hypothetical protein VF553_17420 [Pyrinomonadaceae bacterium]